MPVTRRELMLGAAAAATVGIPVAAAVSTPVVGTEEAVFLVDVHDVLDPKGFTIRELYDDEVEAFLVEWRKQLARSERQWSAAIEPGEIDDPEAYAAAIERGDITPLTT